MKNKAVLIKLSLLAGLLIAFAAPIMISHFIYDFKNRVQTPISPHGFLLKNPVKVSSLSFTTHKGKTVQLNKYKSKWLLLYFFSHCNLEQSLSVLNSGEKLQRTLKDQSSKTQVIPIFSKQCHLSPQFVTSLQTLKPKGLNPLTASSAALKKFNQRFHGDQLGARLGNENRLYLIDPKGYLIMYYRDDTPIQSQYDDLTVLLGNRVKT